MKLDLNKPIYLIGGGGHCKVIFDILLLVKAKIGGYNDFYEVEWLDELKIPRIVDDVVVNLCKHNAQLVMAFIGRDTEALKYRLETMKIYESYGAVFPNVIHPAAIISPLAHLQQGIHILAGATVNAYSHIEEGVVVNSGSIVEHDTVIKSGSHLAPRSTVLGGAVVGSHCYLGSASIIIQGSEIQNGSFIKAGQRYNGLNTHE